MVWGRAFRHKWLTLAAPGGGKMVSSLNMAF